MEVDIRTATAAPHGRIGPDGVISHVDGALWPVLGLAPDELVGRPWDALVHPGDVQRLTAELPRIHAAAPRSHAVRLRALTFGGAHRWLTLDITGRPDGSLDVVARIPDLAPAAPAAPSLAAQLVESAQDAIITENTEAVITSWNRAATRLYGYTAEEAIGAPVAIIVPPERRGEEFSVLAQVLGGGSVDHYETERIGKDGRRVSVSLSLSPVRGEQGEIIGAAAIARDVTERRAMERRLRYLAHHDAVTGLLNRTRFDEELDDRLHRARRSGNGGAVLALDLDGFKLVNDRYGHAAGDALLQRIARALRDNVREVDAVARMGGDEFAVVMSDIAREDAVRAADTLRSRLDVRWEEQRVTASVGVVPFGGDAGLAPGDLLIAADIALYEAKRRGRDRVVEFAAPQADGLSSVTRLRRAIDEQRLVLHAQPIISFADERVIREELLVRMVGEHGEVIPPSGFLPAAERFRCVGEIDRWVLDRAIAIAARGRPVAVNLSGLSLGDRDLMGWVRERIAAAAVRPGALVIEVTETAALERLDEAIRQARALEALGVELALDDFGSGFVHFGVLRHLPVHHLKIGGEFIRGLGGPTGGEARDVHIVRAIIALARGFGLATVAEGVESAAALHAVRQLGVDAAQGYLLGRPGPLAGAHPATAALAG